jgi:hypothetical protein
VISSKRLRRCRAMVVVAMKVRVVATTKVLVAMFGVIKKIPWARNKNLTLKFSALLNCHFASPSQGLHF